MKTKYSFKLKLNFSKQNVHIINIILLILGGVFVFVLCGLTVAVIIAILELCWHSKKKSTDQVFNINFY